MKRGKARRLLQQKGSDDDPEQIESGNSVARSLAVAGLVIAIIGFMIAAAALGVALGAIVPYKNNFGLGESVHSAVATLQSNVSSLNTALSSDVAAINSYAQPNVGCSWVSLPVGWSGGIHPGDIVSQIDGYAYPGYGEATYTQIGPTTAVTYVSAARLQDGLYVVMYLSSTPQPTLVPVTRTGTAYTVGTPVVVTANNTGVATTATGDPFDMIGLGNSSFVFAYVDTSGTKANRIVGGSVVGGQIYLSTLANSYALRGLSTLSGDSITASLGNFKMHQIPGSANGTIYYFVAAYRNSANSNLQFYILQLNVTTPTSPIVSLVLGYNSSSIYVIPCSGVASAAYSFTYHLYLTNVTGQSFMQVWWINSSTQVATGLFNVTLNSSPSITSFGTPVIWGAGSTTSYATYLQSATLQSVPGVSVKTILAYVYYKDNWGGAAVFNANLTTGTITYSMAGQAPWNFYPTFDIDGIWYLATSAQPTPYVMLNLPVVSDPSVSYQAVIIFADPDIGNFGRSMTISLNASDYMIFNFAQRFSLGTTSYIAAVMDSVGSINIFYQLNWGNQLSNKVADTIYAVYAYGYNSTLGWIQYYRTMGNEAVGISLDYGLPGSNVRVCYSGVIYIPPGTPNINPGWGQFTPGAELFLQGPWNGISSFNQPLGPNYYVIEAGRALNASAIQLMNLCSTC